MTAASAEFPEGITVQQTAVRLVEIALAYFEAFETRGFSLAQPVAANFAEIS